jgi:hypothetical protein
MRRTWVLAGAFAVGSAAGAAEPIGSWVLSCEDGCSLRHKDRILDIAGISADLAVQAAGADLVPVVVVRGLPVLNDMAVRQIRVWLRFDRNERIGLGCAVAAASYICSPRNGPVPAFPAARRVTISVEGVGGGADQSRSLDLAGTAQALARLRAAGAVRAPLPAQELPVGWVRLLDKGLRAVGYANGTADLPGFVRSYLGF